MQEGMGHTEVFHGGSIAGNDKLVPFLKESKGAVRLHTDLALAAVA